MKFWVPPTNWFGEDKFKPSLTVGEKKEIEVNSSIKISNPKASPSKKASKDKSKTKDKPKK